MDENTFNSYFKKHDLFYDYDSVYDFEIHYDEYFSESRYIIDKKNYEFRIYGKDDLNRIALMYNFTSDFQFRDRIIVFYGNPGMGKSVTLIGSLKYCYDHDKIGTFYIHCKLLFNLIQNDYEKTKKILKEEIVYLFKNEFKQYIKCCEEIDKYIITSKTKFWDIIKIIEKFLTYKEKKYIFAFDQYNEESIDPGNKEIEALRSRNTEKLNTILVCSMDDKRVKDYKIDDFIEPNHITNNFITKEIERVLDTKDFNIDNGKIFDQTLERIGKTIKNYNILKYIYEYQKEEDLEKYVEDVKNNIMEYLIEFYKINKKPNLNFLMCWTNTFYNINSLYDKKEFISLKYFDLRKNPDLSKNEFEIIYLYPIVEEVMVDIFSKLFYQNIKLNTFIHLLNIDEEAKGFLFEKYVIYNMEQKNNEDSLLFDYFKIDKIIKCDKFVPRKNENSNNFIKSKEVFKSGIYLFKQRIFGGKAFDALIVQIDEKGKAFPYLFQITLRKPNDKIFTLKDLKDNIMDFAKYFDNVYGLSFEIFYFTYIFNYENADEMSDICEIKEMPYIFFDLETETFIDIDKKEVVLNNDNIEKYFISPIKMSFKYGLGKIKKISETLNTSQEKAIVSFIKNEPFFKVKKNQKIYFEISKETLSCIIKEKKQKEIFCIVNLTKEESEKIFFSLLKQDKNFTKDNKSILKYGCLLFFYFDENEKIIPHIILFDGSIYSLNYVPINLLLKNLKVYEIHLYK